MRTTRNALRRLAVAIPAGVLLAAMTAAAQPPGPFRHGLVPVQPDWTAAGQNGWNTRDAATEHIIGPQNVSQLTPRWELTTGGDVTATPTVSHGVVYVPDQAGNLWAVNARTGAVAWSKKIGDYTGSPGDASRTSPAIYRGELVIGNGVQGEALSARHGAYIMGIDAKTGALRWKTLVSSNIYATMTGSPVIVNGVIYEGISSVEEDYKNIDYTFTGSVVALSAETGRILWQTYTAPPGYTGNSVWGSTPAVDTARGLVYVATGNNYEVPAGVCTSPGETNCQQPPADDYFDAVVALNMWTGKVVWALDTLQSDVYPGGPGPAEDWDFGSGPNLFDTVIGGHRTQLLGVGQKSGLYWAINPGTGVVVWKTRVGPLGPIGIEFGSATDGTRIYTAESDVEHTPYTITSATGQQSTITGGSWAALDSATGKILWQTADPQGYPLELGFMSTANDVVYAPSDAGSGDNMYALNAATGAIEWGFPSGGSVTSGAAIVNGWVYWGSGYYTGTNNDKLYAFSLRRRS